MSISKRLTPWILLGFFLSCTSTDGPVLQPDIFILSGSEAGFTAAIQAARMGKSVVLLEPTGHPGGCTFAAPGVWFPIM
ncbi:MAG: FAD-dependent oxidoreductase [Bacteroidia bacterium]|nr:FAD-dependent oxidoreductase [Bacteroidia bacterium]